MVTNGKQACFSVKNEVFLKSEKTHGTSLSASLTGSWFEKNLNRHHFMWRRSSLFEMTCKPQNVKLVPAPLFHGLPLKTLLKYFVFYIQNEMLYPLVLC